MNISLVCACKNRVDALKVSLASWILFEEIKEIIIVDWNSDEPINYLTKIDPRIKVVRVSDQKYFNQPQPLNLAISLAKEEYILKVDTDYVLNPYYNFFEKYSIDDKSFLSGKHNYKSPEYYDEETGVYRYNKMEMSDGELLDYFNSYSPYFKHLTGLLLIKRENLLKVGGYNEILNKYYAFEDDELYSRLELYGLEHKKIDFDCYAIHLPHSDTKRVENFKGYNESYYKKQIDNMADDVEKWQLEYYISQNHIKNNKKICENLVDYHSHIKTIWNIQNIDEQNLFAEIKMSDRLEGLTSVYYISLEESEHRRDNLESQFGRYGITPVCLISKRFAECNDVVTGKYVDTLNEGTKGCCVSQLKAIKNWYENTDENYGFFCEDDLSLETVEYWDFTWKEFIEKIPEDADCVQLLTIRKEYDTFELRERYWDDWAATAYILTREYAKKLIDTYIREDSYHLEIPNSDVMPLIENILFTSIGKTYTYPLFVEEIKFQSTHIGKDDDVVDGQKTNHYAAHKKVLNWWKSKKTKVVEELKTPKKSAKTFTIKALKVDNINVVDCFTYFGEKELLELRVNLLKDRVSKFIICESNYTYDGEQKEYTLKKTIQELGLPQEKIKVIEVDLSLENLNNLNDYDLFFDPNRKYACRQRVLRDSMMSCIDEFDSKTYFIVGNCDEIVNPFHVDFLVETVKNNPGNYFKIPLVKLESRADLRAMYTNGNIVEWKNSLFICSKTSLKLTSPTRIRASFNTPYPIVYPYIGDHQSQDLGWCFSFMGNSSKLKDGSLSPSKEENVVLKDYSKDLLPKIIFDLPKVKNYLLPELNEKTYNIVDCFSYFNEKEILELRINLLKDYVDKFFIVDANYTHSGIKKEYICKKTIKELQLPEEMIEVLEVDLSAENLGNPTEYDQYWNNELEYGSRERIQRDSIAKCLDTNNFDEDTVFIVGDCDEIINPKYISLMAGLARSNRDKIFKCDLDYLGGRADLRIYNKGSNVPVEWNCSLFVCLKEHMEKTSLTHIRSDSFNPYPIVWPYTLERDENGNYITSQRMSSLGWHFSWMGNNNDRLVKSKSFCHSNQKVESESDTYYGSYEMDEFIVNYDAKEGSKSPAGFSNTVLKYYPIENLPQIIFDLPRVKNYLLPEISEEEVSTENDLNQLLYKFSIDTENPENNFNLGLWYEKEGHTAPALSYFLRCAERSTDTDKDLAYESLIRGSFCYEKQGTRDGSARSLLWQAQMFLPDRPEAYFLLARFAEKREWWQDCYSTTDLCLRYCNFDLNPLKTDVLYPGKYAILLLKSISGWQWGKGDESRSILKQILSEYDLNPSDSKLITDNLKKMNG